LVDNLAKDVAKIISDLLSYLNIFMGFYMFVLAIIEMIMCIINVLCAFKNIFKMIRAVKKLITKCMPIFISIVFPWFVLLNLLLTLIAILLALIEYIILMIKRLIEQIIKNLRKLYNALGKGNTAAGLAIINKIANLLCLFEQIFVFLEIVFAIFELITSIWSKTIKGCVKRGKGEDDLIACPEFLIDPVENVSNDPETYKTRVSSENGSLWFMPLTYGVPVTSSFVKLLDDTVYLIDNNLAEELKFKNMIEYDGFPYFPFDRTITSNMNNRKKPYTIDLFVTTNPGDGHGSRKIQVKDITVTNVVTSLYNRVYEDDGLSVIENVNNANGALVLSGGVSVDGYGYNGKTITEVLKGDGIPPIINNTHFEYNNVEHYLKANYESLAEYELISIGCLPSIQIAQDAVEQDVGIGFSGVLSQYVTLPEPDDTIRRIRASLDKYKTSIDEDSTILFGDEVEAALDELQEQCENSYCQLLTAGMVPSNMDFELSTDMQFVFSNINVIITPKDSSGRTLSDMIGSFSPPQSCLDGLAEKFSLDATFGTVSDFAYDGYGKFVCTIYSEESGDGEAKAFFDGQQIIRVVYSDDVAINPVIDDSGKQYSFIGFDTSSGGIRRDETDTTAG
jgi:hypothetical protein